MHMKKTTQKVKHLQYEPPQKYPEATSGAPEGKACPAPSTAPVTLQVRKFQAKSIRWPWVVVYSLVGLPLWHNLYKPITNTAWVHTQLCKLQKGALDSQSQVIQAYQLLAQDRWFSAGTPASSTTKTGRHYIAENEVKTPKIKSNLVHSGHSLFLFY